MYERFTERARQVVVLAQDEARALKHNYIGTEHLFLGLLREEEGVAARVLEDLGVETDHARSYIRRVIGTGDEMLTGKIPFTPRSKKVLDLALREALSLGHNYIGTEHILLGLVREDEGVGVRYLDARKIDSDVVREAVLAKIARKGERVEQKKLSTVNPQWAKFIRLLLDLVPPGKLETLVNQAIAKPHDHNFNFGSSQELEAYAEALARRFHDPQA